jgi:hypothetical protein
MPLPTSTAAHQHSHTAHAGATHTAPTNHGEEGTSFQPVNGAMIGVLKAIQNHLRRDEMSSTSGTNDGWLTRHLKVNGWVDSPRTGSLYPQEAWRSQEYLSNCPKCPCNCPRWTIAWTMDILVDIFNYLMDKWTFPWTIVDIRGQSWTSVDNRGHMDIFVDIFVDIFMDICMDMC